MENLFLAKLNTLKIFDTIDIEQFNVFLLYKYHIVPLFCANNLTMKTLLLAYFRVRKECSN
jgi:hypothetical protein